MSKRFSANVLKVRSALATAVAAGLAVTFSSPTTARAVAPTVDGTLDAAIYGPAFSVQTVQTGFGGHQSEIDAGYSHIENGKLSLFLSGNLESNFNKMVLFFDTRAGGQNVMRGDNPDVDFNNLNTRYVGMTFDAGFSPDYTLFYSRNPTDAYLNFSELNTNGGGFGTFVGDCPTPNANQQGSASFGGANGVPKIDFGYSDANVAGVGGGAPAAANPADALAVTTGSEIVIDLTAIGATENFTMMIGINGSSHDYWSNQFLPGLAAPQGNLGSDGLGNFVPPGSVSAVNFATQVAGNQFLQVNYHAPLSHWNNAGGGNWSDGAKWTALDGVPNASDARAFLDTTAGAAARVITLDTNVSLQSITFDSAGGYTIAPSGGNVLSIGGNPATPAINVISGNHTIAAPVVFTATTNVTVAAGSTLDVTGDLTATGQTVVKHGGGTAQFKNLRANGIFAGEGTLKIASNGTDAGTSKLGAVTINGGIAAPTASFDLNNNDLVTSQSKADIEALVKFARNGGTWDQNGLTSSSAKNNASHNTNLGVLSGAEYNVFGHTGTFSGQTYADTDTLVKYTYNGDSNFSGKIDFDDYVNTDVGFNLLLTGWANGDFNYSGSVNFDDYVLIDVAFNTQSGTLGRAVNFLSGDDRSATGLDDPAVQKVIEHFGQFGVSYGSAFLAAVPEPASLALLGVPALAGMIRRRRRVRD